MEQIKVGLIKEKYIHNIQTVVDFVKSSVNSIYRITVTRLAKAPRSFSFAGFSSEITNKVTIIVL